ncbi:unnamed protein product [Penicillium salamii]|uniref:Uncharacterized protein n=1 Tax=Penicillium salamii TaxID=1612424 RepID=A0A9W4JH28_9EURO|nr:unnamed protein product [Penicillium salamii]CAG8375388.1 unnamed protein product [Penicillium salamii]CAG8390992.1 unnamed protein product [Penicillium salamii]
MGVSMRIAVYSSHGAIILYVLDTKNRSIASPCAEQDNVDSGSVKLEATEWHYGHYAMGSPPSTFQDVQEVE